MIRTFGPDWGAPIYQTAPHDLVPVGVRCAMCGIAFAPDDYGLIIPHIGGRFDPLEMPWHLECFSRHIRGSAQ